LNSNKTELIV